MRKLCFVLTALLLTAPAWATVTMSCSSVGDEVTVSYSSDDPNIPRAFGLDITVSAGTIVEVTEANEYFWVYPGTIQISNGSVSDGGDPYAPSDDPDALGGPGTNGMTIEMGSLYDPCDPEHPTGPGTSEELLKFTVDTDCTVSIAGNAARGNVVLENTEAADVDYGSGCVVVVTPPDCFPAAHPDYATWVARGKPSCWCEPRQCHGDADSGKEGSVKLGYWYVGAPDLAILAAGWQIKEPTKGPGIIGQTHTSGVELVCADFDHGQEGSVKLGYWYLGAPDLSILASYWQVKEPTKGAGVPTDCP